MPIDNRTCNLCVKRGTCHAKWSVDQLLASDYRFIGEIDSDDLFVELGRLCNVIEIEEGQEG